MVIMNTNASPTYDEIFPSDLATLEAVESPHTLALWCIRLNAWEWPEDLAPSEPNPAGTDPWKSQEEWQAAMPDRRDDIMEWIRNKVGAKYLLMVWQCERMLVHIAPGVSPTESHFERWWNESAPGESSLTNGERHLSHAKWWAKTREEWRAARKARRDGKQNT